AGSSGLVETLPFARQLRQQRRGFPETRIPVGIGGEALHAVDDLVQSHLVGVEHRPAPVKGKTVTGQVDHVDVGSTQYNALLQDRCPFVDERKDQSPYDVFIADLAALRS